MSGFYAADTQNERAAAIGALVRSEVAVEEIALCLRRGRDYGQSASPGWATYELESQDGRTRPFLVYVPDSYTPAEPHPLVVYLHGGIGLPRSAAGLSLDRKIWEDAACELGALILMPEGDWWATWWDAVGLGNVMADLAFVKSRYDVDENRVFLSGFSDGGSGVFWIAMHHPSPWAGFMAWHGDPTVFSGSAYPSYPANLANRPIQVVNGVRDPLYPADEERLYVEQLRDLGVEVDWRVRVAEHEFGAAAVHEVGGAAFVSSHERDPFPERVVWETADARVGRCDWIRIDRIGRYASDVFEPSNLLYLQATNDLGVVGSYDYGEGVFVELLRRGFVAERCGVRPDDIILEVDGVRADSESRIRRTLEALVPGEALTIEVDRGGRIVELSGTAPEPFPVYSRDRTTAAVVAESSGNRIAVRASNVRRLTLLLSSSQFDLAKPVEVEVNGVIAFRETASPDVRFMLEQAAIDVDRRVVYEAKIEISLDRHGAPSSPARET
jgi:hypothetical protein